MEDEHDLFEFVIMLPYWGNDARRYFDDALEVLVLLEPFADENIDFSIMCDRARDAVQGIARNPVFSALDRSKLATLVATPSVVDFAGAKAYLDDCLAFCVREE